ncbi:hypothetical protein [Nocardia carnea]|uniref:hypothetical protein n=1 Tax=Nocardia carnea TaxID=37328 RepID=UPI00245618FA|nr:hypothetical protein [Nocardia carnea]
MTSTAFQQEHPRQTLYRLLAQADDNPDVLYTLGSIYTHLHDEAVSHAARGDAVAAQFIAALCTNLTQECGATELGYGAVNVGKQYALTIMSRLAKRFEDMPWALELLGVLCDVIAADAMAAQTVPDTLPEAWSMG